MTPASLPFEWQVDGPSGPMTLTDAGSLRPHFQPVVAGAYQARLTYCPRTCQNRLVGTDLVDIPPQTASVAIIVVDKMPVPPSTQPVLTPTALTPPSLGEMETENAFHQESERKCGFPGALAAAQTPQLVPVRPFVGAGDYRLLEGRVRKTNIAWNDNELNHYSHDIGIHVEPDPQHLLLKVEGHEDMEIEWESNYFPGSMRPSAGDRISAFGFQTYDCHHSPIGTEIHPPVLTAVHRSRAVRIPDGWAPPGGDPLGSNIWVPGIITDIWANARAGEMTSNCSDTGMHQEAILAPPGFPVRVLFGNCIRSPHPIRRSYSFNIYLPENPQTRVAAAGLAAPPAPLHYRVEPGGGPLPLVVPMTDGGVSFLRVTVDLSGFTGETYGRRIVAGWVQPSPENWGLERWKAGIPSMQVYEDHDLGTDGDWVFWTSVNNRDQEWTRLLNGNSVDEGTYNFGGRPWETESPYADRSLGPHLLLFNPRFSQYFPGSPLVDLTLSLELHTSGYDEEFWDDEVGMVSTISRPDPATLGVGERRTLTQVSSTGDYRLTYFYERLGPVAGANLTARRPQPRGRIHARLDGPLHAAPQEPVPAHAGHRRPDDRVGPEPGAGTTRWPGVRLVDSPDLRAPGARAVEPHRHAARGPAQGGALRPQERSRAGPALLRRAARGVRRGARHADGERVRAGAAARSRPTCPPTSGSSTSATSTRRRPTSR